VTLLHQYAIGGGFSSVVENARRESRNWTPDSRSCVMVAEENMSIPYGARVWRRDCYNVGGLALVLATMGLYSVMTYAVSHVPGKSVCGWRSRASP